MTEQNPNPVVVAVGYDPIDAALGFAAGEAARAGCGLHLVHVVHLLAQGPEMILVTETDVERIGRQTLNAALERAHDIVPAEVPVSGEQRIGAVVPTLVDMAKDARMIVLERRDLSRMTRAVTRSVSSGVAVHARVPVVSVPSYWAPESAHGEFPTVTVGVDVPDRAERVLRAGAMEARSRGAALHALHTWSFPRGYDDVVLPRTESQEWADRATAEVRAAIDALGDEVDGVPIRIEARHAYAADALIEASRESELLVIGRHDPLVPIGSHLGPIARAVLRDASCPLLFADPRPNRMPRWHSKMAAETVAQPV